MLTSHFAKMIGEYAAKYGDRNAIRYQRVSSDEWHSYSWNQFSELVDLIAKAFIQLGIKPGDKVGQYSQNMAENLIVDFALYSNRAVMVPIYATSSPQQLEYIVKDSGMKILFVGEQEQYDNALQVVSNCPELLHIVAIDAGVNVVDDHGRSLHFSDLVKSGQSSTKDDVLAKRRDEASLKDTAAIFYTSGTTGNPKGVVLIHEGMLHQVEMHHQRYPSLGVNDVALNFLPFTHVFERMCTYLYLYVGAETAVNLRPQKIQQAVKEIRPTAMCSVPRFWEKVYIGIKEKLDSYSPVMLGVVTWAIATGRKYNIDYRRQERKPSWLLKLRYNIADKLIFSKVKRIVGIERGTFFPTAGAALADNVNEFFQSLGIPILYGYGLTETYATVSSYPYTHWTMGSIGRVIEGLDVRIGEDNEILVKGVTVMQGYYNRPDANADAFTEDGYFRTGDAGFMRGRDLFLTDRIKDLFKTSNGKYIAPQQIETLLTSDPLIEQVAVIGDKRNYVTAIVAPNMEMLRKEAVENGWAFQSDDDLVAHPAVNKFILARIEKMQEHMAHFEVIKKITLIKKGFSIETGELTNTLKLRRAIIQQKYAAAIDAMYQ
ncbi:MAG: long-chain fatty acid--CoA ligase [Paludibacteraceae bacterium]|nr:long-chain fatty acid--CoA ligase [Paludibacteraceae bacterium]